MSFHFLDTAVCGRVIFLRFNTIDGVGAVLLLWDGLKLGFSFASSSASLAFKEVYADL